MDVEGERDEMSQGAIIAHSNIIAVQSADAFDELRNRRIALVNQIITVMWEMNMLYLNSKDVLSNANLYSFSLFGIIRQDNANMAIAWNVIHELKNMKKKAAMYFAYSSPLLEEAKLLKRLLMETYGSETLEEESGPKNDALFCERQMLKFRYCIALIVSMVDYFHFKCEVHLCQRVNQLLEHSE